MIAVACPKCQAKLKVKEDMAGKRVRCPTCKEPIAVSAPVSAIAEGATLPPSGQAFRGADDATLAPAPSARRVEAAAAPGHERREQRYHIEDEIARGGMGAVMRALDQDISREVAVKYLLNQSDARQKARFIEEAKITGQLEHPNIVPIHDLGVDGEGRLYFSMKMVKGRSLAGMLEADVGQAASLSNGECRQGGSPTLGQLLSVFINICHALAYAHARGVIHRDLKPANVMVGDFGEVYVMDWGLAKVLDDPPGREAGDKGISPPLQGGVRGGKAGSASPAAASQNAKPKTKPASRAGKPAAEKVKTDRQPDSDLTQDGAVMGTPAYMPPEQARGEPADQRSDIYSLGAILYEILTLTPPVGRSKDPLGTLMRVIEGDIEAPEKRAPERARQGWAPPELSAVALKALAKDPDDRYQTVEALQRDIQLFQEGRSVSAKQDTAWQMFKKLVKRNKGVSVATAVALVVLAGVAGFFLKINYDARVEAEKANRDYRAEQEAKRLQAKESVPAFVRAAKMLVNESQFDDAMKQVNIALNFDEDAHDARLLRAQLLIGKQNYQEAQQDLEKLLKARPEDAAAQRLTKLSKDAVASNTAHLVALANEFSQQKHFTLASLVTDQAAKLFKKRDEILAPYWKRILAAWPNPKYYELSMDATGQVSLRLNASDLTPLVGMKIDHLALGQGSLKDLSPLKGMPLASLSIAHCKVSDLRPLEGMQLKSLRILNCPVGNLAPLQGMPLEDISLSEVPVGDLTPLKGMKLHTLGFGKTGVSDLTPLEGMPLRKLNISWNHPVRDLGPLRGMELTELVLDFCNKINDLSPLQGMPLTKLEITGPNSVRDIKPLAGVPLKHLLLRNCERLTNVDALKDVKQLEGLSLSGCAQINDISGLRGLPLISLDLYGCNAIKDLLPLEGLPLKSLNLNGCTAATSLPSLQAMPLESLSLGRCSQLGELAHLGPIKGMKLKTLSLTSCPQVKSLAALKGMPLTTLNLGQCTGVTDLSPLANMRLTEINLPPVIDKGLDVVRNMPSLEKINGNPRDAFWKEYDAKKAGK